MDLDSCDYVKKMKHSTYPANQSIKTLTGTCLIDSGNIDGHM